MTEFVLFALTLVGVAVFHHHTLRVALTGLAAIIGGTIAATVFRHKVHIGYLAAIVAAGVALALFIPLRARDAPIGRDPADDYNPAGPRKFSEWTACSASSAWSPRSTCSGS